VGDLTIGPHQGYFVTRWTFTLLFLHRFWPTCTTFGLSASKGSLHSTFSALLSLYTGRPSNCFLRQITPKNHQWIRETGCSSLHYYQGEVISHRYIRCSFFTSLLCICPLVCKCYRFRISLQVPGRLPLLGTRHIVYEPATQPIKAYDQAEDLFFP
jgi:hypothetical protein